MRASMDQDLSIRYGRALEKTFRSALSSFVQKEFPQLGGPLIVDLFVERLETMIKEFFPPTSCLKMGQLLWFAVAKEEKASHGKSMAETKIVPVVLTLICHQDMRRRIDGTPWFQIKRDIKARLCREAYEQGGVLSRVDLSLLTQSCLKTISKHLQAYQKENDCVLPYRGTVHDMGSNISHKGIICKKRFLERKSVSQTARETHHSPEAVSRYEVSFNRVLFCLEKGLSVQETSFVTRLSKNLILQYQNLGQEIDKAKQQGDIDFDDLPF